MNGLRLHRPTANTLICQYLSNGYSDTTFEYLFAAIAATAAIADFAVKI